MDRTDLHPYQERAIQFVKDNTGCALFLDMGLGKSVITLTAISEMPETEKVLIIAPLMVANTVWRQEADKWSHLSSSRMVVCTGNSDERDRSACSDHDILVINRENVQWLVENCKWQWDMVVIDESSSFKSPKAKRFRALRRVLPKIKRTVLLTGTPAPNGYMDLWSQLFLIDRGQRLGKTISGYRQRFFNQTGFRGYSYVIRDGAADKINSVIEDVCLTMRAKDYLELPDYIPVTRAVELPPGLKRKYKKFEKEFLLTLEDETVPAPTAAGLANKLLQFCNGFVYDEDGNTLPVHDLKTTELAELVGEENLLVAYNFRADLEKLKSAFPDAVDLRANPDAVDAWNRGEIKMLLVHPASAGHGLNLQDGGSVIVWFGMNWSLELYQQLNARLYRQGQTKPVRVIHLVVADSIDEKVVSALSDKDMVQNQLLNYMRNKLKKGF